VSTKQDSGKSLEAVLSAPIPGDEIHVVTVQMPRQLAAIRNLVTLLSPDEVARARHCIDPRARLHFIAGRGVLRHLLAIRTGLRAPNILLTYGHRGKPAAAAANLAFNLSHGGAWLLLAFASRADVGVDVETRFTASEATAIARRMLAPDEQTALAATPPRRRAALVQRYWVLKEALMKAYGDGFARRPATLALELRGRAVRCSGGDGALFDWQVDRKTRAAVALAGTSCARLVHHRPGSLAALLRQTGVIYQETGCQ
jgi:4'-phosphopantetheinyl transferase